MYQLYLDHLVCALNHIHVLMKAMGAVMSVVVSQPDSVKLLAVNAYSTRGHTVALGK